MIRDRSIAALLAGELVSRLGSQLTYLALPWFVLVTTGSPTGMVFVFAAQLVPMALRSAAPSIPMIDAPYLGMRQLHPRRRQLSGRTAT